MSTTNQSSAEKLECTAGDISSLGGKQQQQIHSININARPVSNSGGDTTTGGKRTSSGQAAATADLS